MAGYSSTPLPKKLGIKEGHTVSLISAPAGFDATLGPLPTGVFVRRDTKGAKPIDVILAFTKSETALVRALGPLAKRLDPEGGLWNAWPKKASGVVTDLTDNVVRAHGLRGGLVDNKVCAIDDVWSALRLVYRLTDRPKTKTKGKSR